MDGGTEGCRARDVTPYGLGTPGSVQSMTSDERRCSGLEKEMPPCPRRGFGRGRKLHLADVDGHTRHWRVRRHHGRSHVDNDTNRTIIEYQPDRLRRWAARLVGWLTVNSCSRLR